MMWDKRLDVESILLSLTCYWFDISA